MGLSIQFSCPRCAYRALVSGGNDCGMDIFTTTIACLDCRNLRDVVIGKAGTEGNIRPPRCPRSARHVIKPWIREGPCPRCDTPMQAQDIVCLWD